MRLTYILHACTMCMQCSLSAPRSCFSVFSCLIVHIAAHLLEILSGMGGLIWEIWQDGMPNLVRELGVEVIDGEPVSMSGHPEGQDRGDWEGC